VTESKVSLSADEKQKALEQLIAAAEFTQPRGHASVNWATMRLKMLKPLLVDWSTAKALVGLKHMGSPLCEEEDKHCYNFLYKARLILLFHGSYRIQCMLTSSHLQRHLPHFLF